MAEPTLILAERYRAAYTDIQCHKSGAQAEVYSAQSTALRKPEQVAILPDTFHVPHRERPAAVIELVCAFLEPVRQGGAVSVS